YYQGGRGGLRNSNVGWHTFFTTQARRRGAKRAANEREQTRIRSELAANGAFARPDEVGPDTYAAHVNMKGMRYRIAPLLRSRKPKGRLRSKNGGPTFLVRDREDSTAWATRPLRHLNLQLACR